MPTIEKVDVVDENLEIEWSSESTPIRPIDGYKIIVNISSEDSTDQETQEFTVDGPDNKQYTLGNVDPDKVYTVVVCSRNKFGTTCSSPVTHAPVPTTAPLSDPPPKFAPGLIALIVVICLLLLLVCCLLLLCILCCIISREREKRYFPAREGVCSN